MTAARPVRRSQKRSAARRRCSGGRVRDRPDGGVPRAGPHARNRSPKTIKTYMEAVRILEASLVEQGMPTTVGRMAREHVETFIAD